MMRTMLTTLLLGATAAAWASGPWLEDFEAAKKAASASGKPILVDVTGSDWCPPCLQMEAEVFSRPDFLAAASRYVLLRLDYPRNKAQPERLRVQNRRFAELYPFEGFPTYFLMDAQGMVVGKQTGYVPGGVKAFVALTTGFEAQKATLTGLVDAVKKATGGPERAKAQDALFRQAETWGLVAQYGDLPLKIIQEDKEGKAGLRVRYQVYNAYNRLLGTWTQGSDFQKAIDDLDRLATQALAWPELRQRIVFTKGMVWLNALGDEFMAREAFWQVRSLGAETPVGQRAAELLDQLP